MIAAPALMQWGIHPLVSHMFVLYFAVLADVTPPVALAAYAASGISGADPFNVIGQLREKLHHNAVAMQMPIGAEDQLQGVRPVDVPGLRDADRRREGVDRPLPYRLG